MNQSNIKWLFSSVPIDITRIHAVACIFGIMFPQDFTECAMTNHGGSPSKNAFDFPGRKSVVFDSLLSFNQNDSNYIVTVYQDIKDYLLSGVYPFAADPFGNFICFYYQNYSYDPTIVFWDHEIASLKPEKALFLVCESFSGLLDLLYSPDQKSVFSI